MCGLALQNMIASGKIKGRGGLAGATSTLTPVTSGLSMAKSALSSRRKASAPIDTKIND